MPGTKGNSGRRKLPTYIKLTKGTARKHRENKDEPKPDISLPKTPDGMHKEVEKEFNILAKITYDMGILSEWHVPALEICAIAIVEFKKASAVLLDEGPDIESTNKDGKTVIVRRGHVAWAENSYRRLSSMLAKFGLSPSDMSNVNIIHPKKTKSKWDFM